MQKGPSPLEIERKFLIRYPEVSWLADRQGSRCAELTQTYLRSDGHSSRRVRSWTESGKTVWYETSKRMVTDITREEIEREISEEEYLALLKEADPARQQIRKTRWSATSDSLQRHELQHARPPCPSPTPRVHSNSCPSSQ